MNILSETEKSYIAALIDGEGSVQILKIFRPLNGNINPAYSCSLDIYNRSLEILKFLKDKTGEGTIRKCKKIFSWHIGPRKTEELLRIIYPYLVIKKNEANLIFLERETYLSSHIDGNGTHQEILELRETYYQNLKRLHKLEKDIDIEYLRTIVSDGCGIISDTEASYIAGIIDGEGNIRIKKNAIRGLSKTNSFSSHIYISNTNPNLLLWIREKIKSGILEKRKRNSKCRICYGLTIGNENAKNLLIQLLPYLILKKERANLLIEFRNSISPVKTFGNKTDDQTLFIRENFFQQMKKLNIRGVYSEL